MILSVGSSLLETGRLMDSHNSKEIGEQGGSCWPHCVSACGGGKFATLKLEDT